MLVLTRKSNESVIIDGSISVKVLSVHGDQVSLGLSAPREVSIHRKEVYEAIQRQNLEAAKHSTEHLRSMRGLLDKHLSETPDFTTNNKKKGVMPASK